MAGRETRLASRRFSLRHARRFFRSRARAGGQFVRNARVITLFSLLVVVAYVAISIAVIVVVARKKGGRIAGVVAAGLFLLGTWDVILGRAALWYSCEFKRTAVFPSERIAMPKEYFNRRGHIDLYALEKNSPYLFRFQVSPVLAWVGLEERRASISDRRLSSEVVVQTSFGVSPGWLERFASPRMQSCSNVQFDLEQAFEMKSGS